MPREIPKTLLTLGYSLIFPMLKALVTLIDTQTFCLMDSKFDLLIHITIKVAALTSTPHSLSIRKKRRERDDRLAGKLDLSPHTHALFAEWPDTGT